MTNTLKFIGVVLALTVVEHVFGLASIVIGYIAVEVSHD